MRIVLRSPTFTFLWWWSDYSPKPVLLSPGASHCKFNHLGSALVQRQKASRHLPDRVLKPKCIFLQSAHSCHGKLLWHLSQMWQNLNVFQLYSFHKLTLLLLAPIPPTIKVMVCHLACRQYSVGFEIVTVSTVGDPGSYGFQKKSSGDYR